MSRALTAILAAILLPLLATAPAAAKGKVKSTKPDTVASCGTITAGAAHDADATRVELVRVQRTTCATARLVVRRCIANRLAKGWIAVSPKTEIVLVRGRTRVAFHTVNGPVPRCVSAAQRRVKGAHAAELRLTHTVTAGDFGPFEGPVAYPSTWPAPYRMVYEWASPVTTYRAAVPAGSVSSVTLSSAVHNPDGDVRSVWFEWGRTRDLGSASEKDAPPVRADHTPAYLSTTLSHLRAGTRYWWRAAANIDGPNGVETRYGTLGTFVTNPYPKLGDPNRPCRSRPATVASLFELTESLAIDCSGERTFTKGACFPACSSFYNGKLACDRTFPRNLNAGRQSFTIPKIGIGVSVNDLVSYWRSNDSNRFLQVPGKNRNSGGGNVGPVPGWHEWDVAQWAYPFTSTSTRAEFWIYCTEQWGSVINGDALAQGDGGERASVTAPSVPTGLTATPAADGGIDVAWQPSASASPTGLAGYAVTLGAWRPGEPKTFNPQVILPVTTSGTTGRISAARLRIIRASLPAGYDLYVAVAAVSREGSASAPATVPWPRA